jgi:uncharacterized protein (TIGR02145 family)
MSFKTLRFMSKINKIYILQLIIIFFLSLIYCCNKEETVKKIPVINWTNPEDISFGTLLTEKQLNATSDVPGTFVYTPPIGTELNEGENQILKVNFTPTDMVNYDTISKLVKINITHGSTIVFNSDLTYDIVSDIDGNLYKTIRIGSQIWIAENLKTTRYNDGTPIPHITDSVMWSTLTSPAYCWYNNEDSFKTTFGALYNWYAVNTGKLSPKGWHIPSYGDWITLVSYLGGGNDVGGKLKESGTIHWKQPNKGASNSSGFSAIPGGLCFKGFGSIFYDCYFWSSTPGMNEGYAHFCKLLFDNSDAIFFISSGYLLNNKCGFSVRCVKDN